MKTRRKNDSRRNARSESAARNADVSNAISPLIYRAIFGVAATAAIFSAFSGCAALNEDPNNDRYWFPTLRPYTEEERAARARTFPEGGDPYCDAEVGPRSISPRPFGWDVQRSKTYSSTAVFPVKPEFEQEAANDF